MLDELTIPQSTFRMLLLLAQQRLLQVERCISEHGAETLHATISELSEVSEKTETVTITGYDF